MSHTESLHPLTAGEAHRAGAPEAVPLVTLGLALSSFFAVSYLICILGYFALPEFRIQHEVLVLFLPGFSLLSWRTFFLGLVESLLWGWYVAIVFGWLYNFFLRRAH